MSWGHIGDTKPKGRKDYRCYLCGLSIGRGTVHVKRIGADCGELSSTRMHGECEDLTKSWNFSDWEAHDECEFRKHELEITQNMKEGDNGISITCSMA